MGWNLAPMIGLKNIGKTKRIEKEPPMIDETLETLVQSYAEVKVSQDTSITRLIAFVDGLKLSAKEQTAYETLLDSVHADCNRARSYHRVFRDAFREILNSEPRNMVLSQQKILKHCEWMNQRLEDLEWNTRK